MSVRAGRAIARPSARKQPGYKSYSFPGPTLGLVAMNNLAVSMPGAAAVLENIFPTPEGGKMRRGKQLYATLGNGVADVVSMFSYVIGGRREFFAATDDAIYNITSISSPRNMVIGTEGDDIVGTENEDMIGLQSTAGLDVVTGTLGGKWSVVQFSTAGGTYLVGVNGADAGFVYDGQTFYPHAAGGLYRLRYTAGTVAFTEGGTLTGATSGATATIIKVLPADPDNPEVAGDLWLSGLAGDPFQSGEAITDGDGGSAEADGAEAVIAGTNITFKDGVGLTVADLSYVWVHKNRLWFLQRDSLDGWYLPVNSIAGELTRFPLGSVLGKGGHIVFGTTWSQDVGDGLNALCAFVSSEGEAAVYSGSDPGGLNDWGIVGVYQTGKPMGPKAHVRIGGDIAMASDIAFVPLSEALRREYSQLGANSLSAPIEALWPVQVDKRRAKEWHCEFWSANQMIAIALPTVNQQAPAMLVMNSRTGKWAWFTNWGATCLHVFNDRLFCGDTLGRVYELNVTGLDDGEPYTATVVPAFDQMGEIGNKTVHMVRSVVRSAHQVDENTWVHADYTIDRPSNPPASVPTPTSQWGSVKWGAFAWGAAATPIVQQPWRSQFGAGEVISVGVQITSGDNIPLDAEFIRTDVLFTVASVLS